jgi:hypothetical protein
MSQPDVPLSLSISQFTKVVRFARTTDAAPMLAVTQLPSHILLYVQVGVSLLEPLTALPCAYPKAKQVGRESES